jgi:ribbon-helix-helix protein
MPKKTTFINPLTRSSEEELHLPHPADDTAAESKPTQGSPPPSPFLPIRKRGNQAFEKTHTRFTSWVDKGLKQQFEKLAADTGVSKTSLVNEAIADVLRKYMQK